MASSSKSDGQLNIEGNTIQVTSLDKILYPKMAINKQTYLQYLIEVKSVMLPFLKNRCLTVKRYPHGMFDDFFYQKNCPDYAPSFVETFQQDDIRYILCNDLSTLIWLGNQLALEFHIPFNKVTSVCPSEIVFDLDPPSRDHFSLAIEAALQIKTILDRLELHSFVKTSGNKGLQIYIPLQENQFTYEDTRIFTQFVAEYLVDQSPDSFTIERLKNKRGSRCYIDFLQHAEGKTIIAPYSLRGNDEGLVATPLEWNEVDQQLTPLQFTMDAVLERLENQECPFTKMDAARKKQPFERILTGLLKQKNG
ncbi:non-homologous end-joining DNA ligase [Alkalihalobacillus sp. TS-13]|uniref:non-homologous end-joining DNA ligase n=1 Tax=Alkalihalobacillus sp. TS-13 TaxID=2842455 RepID=UPI001C88B01D|nr:non-homologous end-joining DNA ligase [Alkalihalobacillus sp. TS-13]